MTFCMLSLDPLRGSLVEPGGSSLENEDLSKLEKQELLRVGVKKACGGIGREKY